MKLILNKGHFLIGDKVKGTSVYMERLNGGMDLKATVVEYTPAHCKQAQRTMCKCKSYGETITLQNEPYGTVVHCQYYPIADSIWAGMPLWELDEDNN
jgi:hypothetical protein